LLLTQLAFNNTGEIPEMREAVLRLAADPS
jgi:hypothetical protein